MVAVASVAPPVMKPLHQTRATPDVLLDVGAAAADAARAAVADLRGDADRDVREAAGVVAGRRRVDRRAGAGRLVGDAASRPSPRRRRRLPSRRSSLALRRAAVRRRRAAVSVPLPAVCLVGVPRRLARAPAVAAGDAGSADLGDVEQLGRDQPADGGSSSASAQGDVVEVASAQGIAARAGDDLAGHRARRRRDAGRAGARDVHALRERPRREPDRASWRRSTEAETGALAWAATRVQDRARRRTRRQLDSVRRRDARACGRRR